jgi:hypothetical protein
MSNLSTFPTSQNLVLPVVLPTYALQLLTKLIKRTERFALKPQKNNKINNIKYNSYCFPYFLTHFDSFFNRKVYVREPAKPFVSMAEMMRKFQSSTKDMPLPHVNDST